MGENGIVNGVVGRAPDRWLPGAVPNPSGRPVGARARYADKFLADAFASWKQHGTAALESVGATRHRPRPGDREPALFGGHREKAPPEVSPKGGAERWQAL
jgi:hypothetical protein